MCNMEIIKGSLPSSAAIWEYIQRGERQREQDRER